MRPMLRMLRAGAALGLQRAGVPVASVVVPRLALRQWREEGSQSGWPDVRGSVAIAVTRNDTWLQWGAYAALWARRLGYAPAFVFSKSEVEHIMRGGRRGPLRRWLVYGEYLASLGSVPDVTLVDLDEEVPAESALAFYRPFADDYAHTSAAYDCRTEERETSEHSGPYRERLEFYRATLPPVAAKAEAAFRKLSVAGVRRLILPSGLIGVTSALHLAARNVGWTTVCVETYSVRPGLLVCNTNAPALDIDPRPWMAALEPDWPQRRVTEIEPFLRYQESPRVVGARWLRGHLRFQRSSLDDPLPPHIKSFLRDSRPMALLAPCGVADSGTLRRQRVFASQREWIHKTCGYFKQHPEWKLIVRAHPVEYSWRKKLRIRVGDIAAEAAGNASNILVIRGNEKASTYAMLQDAHVGIVWVSNVGVDMVIRGCPVIAAGNPCYSGLGLVEEPVGPAQYFEKIAAALTQRSITTPEQQDAGKKYITIIYRDREFPAIGPDHLGQDVHLFDDRHDENRRRFYGILVGELPLATRPLPYGA
jgi:hypothetical protein